MRPRWLRLVLDGGSYNPRVRALAHQRSGAYAIRERDSHRVMYVGESSCGKLWKTMLRHFQAPESFAKVRETGVFRKGAQHYDVAIWPTSKGVRRCTRQGAGKNEAGDQKALEAQAKWIASLSPEKNKDDGKARDDSGEGFRAHRARQAQDEDPWGGMLNPGPRAPRLPSGTVAYDVRDVLAGAYRGKDLGERTLLSHALYVDANGDETKPSTACGRVKSERLVDVHGMRAGSPITCEECAVRVARAGLPRWGLVVDPLREKARNPRGTLTNMGALTEIQGRDLRTKRARVLRWPVSKAPTLAYDDAPRLFVVYGGRVERPTTAKETAEYRRTHWGKSGRGVVTEGGVAVPPFRRIMVAESITYTTQKGTDSEPVDYVHAWGEGARGKWLPPIVVEHECHPETCRGAKCAAKGAIALMGGTYTVDDRGIVG